MKAARFDRIAWSILLVGCIAVLGLSRWLTPNAGGTGTHMQLGLPPCGFLYLFGKPCPACGLTTAFAHLAHFDLMASLHTQPMGLPLFALTILLVPVSALGLVRQRPIAALFNVRGIEGIALTLVFGLLAVWIVRLVA